VLGIEVNPYDKYRKTKYNVFITYYTKNLWWCKWLFLLRSTEKDEKPKQRGLNPPKSCKRCIEAVGELANPVDRRLPMLIEQRHIPRWNVPFS